jgi:hypothetical protein
VITSRATRPLAGRKSGVATPRCSQSRRQEESWASHFDLINP